MNYLDYLSEEAEAPGGQWKNVPIIPSFIDSHTDNYNNADINEVAFQNEEVGLYTPGAEEKMKVEQYVREPARIKNEYEMVEIN